MKIFLDTGIVDEVKEFASTGLIDGVTTNPSLIANSGRTREEVIKELTEIISGPISAEVISTDKGGMIEEGLGLAKIHKNVVVKLPLTFDGLVACKELSLRNIKTNVTLCFSPLQALLAAKNGATYISPFVGRLDDIGHSGMQLIQEIKEIYMNYGFTTQILTASVRHPEHMLKAALIGSDVATIPSKVLRAMINHPLTDKGLDQFLSDFAKSKS